MPRRKENSHVALFSAFEGMWAEQAGCALFDSSGAELGKLSGCSGSYAPREEGMRIKQPKTLYEILK